MSVHGGAWKERDGYLRCDHCGSLSPQEALRRMTTPGCSFSGTDKGAYKFYFESETGDHGKFYGEHLDALTDTQLEEFATASRRTLGVDLYRREGKLRTQMPKSGTFYGWQTFGKIGDDGAPVFDKGSPVPPPEGWFFARLDPLPMCGLEVTPGGRLCVNPKGHEGACVGC